MSHRARRGRHVAWVVTPHSRFTRDTLDDFRGVPRMYPYRGISERSGRHVSSRASSYRLSGVHTYTERVRALTAAFGRVHPAADGVNVSCACPIPSCSSYSTGKLKLSVRVDSGVYHCWVCGAAGRNIARLAMRYATPAAAGRVAKVFDDAVDRDDTPEAGDIVVNLPTGFRLIDDVTSAADAQVADAARYLAARGVSIHDAMRMRLGYVDGRVVFPSFDASGHLNYYVARSCRRGLSPKYVNPPVPSSSVVFNEIDIDWSSSRPLVVVEGPFDALKFTCAAERKGVDVDVTALLGSLISTRSALFRRVVEASKPVVLVFDADAYAKMTSAATMFASFDVPVSVAFTPSEAGDVGAMRSDDDIVTLYNDAVPWDADTCLRLSIERIR